MARQSDLRARIRGLEKRLERAEALLRGVRAIANEQSLIVIASILDNEAEKIDKFLGEPIDGAQE